MITDGWTLVYTGYDPEQEGLREALCTLGNGYFATRGASPDAHADGIHYPGTYLAGGYDRQVTEIQGREVENEDLVNLPNWLPLTFRVGDGDWLGIDRVEVLDCEQVLDLGSALLLRTLRLRDAAGRTTRWEERRLVSMARPHLAGLRVILTPEDWSGTLTVRSALDGSVVNNGVERYRELEGRHLETLATEIAAADSILLRSRTLQSRLEIAEAARTRVLRDGEPVEGARETRREHDRIAQEITLEVAPGTRVHVEKLAALYTGRDAAISEPGLEACKALARAPGFEALERDHRRAWADLWRAADLDLEVEDENDVHTKLRGHQVHLLQTVSYHTGDLDVGVPARGWHGEAYRGHIFWDELFIFPFLNLRFPELTRATLRYRHRRLPEARAAARAAGFRGAMYPWQSGSDGREESQRLHLNPRSGRWVPDDSHRQRHIGAAIAYNVWQYHQVTADDEFLFRYGAEMLLEIARFWASIAAWDPALERYRIRGVMGPDEYHTAYPDAPPEAGGLDDNAYTNVMAAWVLARARDVLELLPRGHRERLVEALELDEAEVESWLRISRRLQVPFHGDGIISQFDGYERLEELDWEGYRERYGDIQRLDRILEAEDDTPNRYKASKQADVLMLFYLFSSEELALLFEQLGYPFDQDLIPRNIRYYLERTSHGSTLSFMVHSWVLARSDRPRAWALFKDALASDFVDIQGGTTPEGIHLGAMAGTLDLVQRCLTGIETRANVLHFNPALPEPLRRVELELRYRGHELRVTVTHDLLRVASEPVTAEPITLAYRGHFRDLSPGQTWTVPLLRPEEKPS